MYVKSMLEVRTAVGTIQIQISEEINRRKTSRIYPAGAARARAER